MRHEPLISIIMPAYNSERFIAESIESVIVQTYSNWELIIIDDGSDDNTASIVKHFSLLDNRIKYLYQKNQKQAKARNYGIENSTGELIAFLDADDLWVSKKLEIQIEAINRTGVDLVFSNGYVFTQDLNETKVTLNTVTGYFQGDDAIKLFLIQNRIPILSVLTKRQAIEDAGGFESGKNIIEDYQLWLKILIKGLVIYGLPDKLVYYRRHGVQETTNDPLQSERVFYMLIDHLIIPERLEPFLNRAILIWGKNWYLNNSLNRKSAENILNKIVAKIDSNCLISLTRLSLVLFGVWFSKRFMNIMVHINVRLNNY